MLSEDKNNLNKNRTVIILSTMYFYIKCTVLRISRLNLLPNKAKYMLTIRLKQFFIYRHIRRKSYDARRVTSF